MRGLRLFQLVSIVETLSLAIILLNRFTIHLPVITSTGGPVHGLFYVSTIVFALILPIPRGAKWLAVIPGIGGLLAVARTRRVRRREALEASVPPERPPLRRPAQEFATPQPDSAAFATGLVKRYTPERQIGPLAFSVPRGRITGLIGPNGAGKTTILRMLVGLAHPTSGDLDVLGRSADELHLALPRVGALIDGPAFVGSLSGRDNLLVLARLAGWPDTTVDTVLAQVGLTERARSSVSTYSLGMRQRIGLAAALLGAPDLVILDEPANGLDPQGAAQLREFLTAQAEAGRTIVVSSHVLADIEAICDHLIVMSEGSVVFEGSPSALVAEEPEHVVCGVATPGERATLISLIERDGTHVQPRTELSIDVLAPGSRSGELNALAASAGITLTELRVVRPSLQDAFFALTGDPGQTEDVVADAATADAPRGRRVPVSTLGQVR
ncbi:ABC transporter ATP-binding protein [uncultured Microbacterium sp.]|uniref:ABC transporter ATP-binding protein n=1 Tax=uncultured Microbacterium sp. TaxID=191216 RepID=UPI0035CC9E03